MTREQRLEKFFEETQEYGDPHPGYKALMWLNERKISIEALERLWLLPDNRT